jgi:hypothetical protein
MIQSEEQKKLDIFSNFGIIKIFSSQKMSQLRSTYCSDVGSQMNMIVLSKTPGIQQRCLDNLIIMNGNF